MVGYTNAGKSTLMNTLTKAEVFVADQLFATLDPTTRRIQMPSGKEALLTDTVGFIQKLPTTLVPAFRATLEEITESDIIVHVVDSAHPHAMQHIETVEDTLAEIDTPRLPTILALNKIDLWDSAEDGARFADLPYDYVVPISARKGTGIDELLLTIEAALRQSMVVINMTLPYRFGDLISALHSQGIVESEKHTAQGVEIRGYAPPALAELIESRRKDNTP